MNEENKFVVGAIFGRHFEGSVGTLKVAQPMACVNGRLTKEKLAKR